MPFKRSAAWCLLNVSFMNTCFSNKFQNPKSLLKVLKLSHSWISILVRTISTLLRLLAGGVLSILVQSCKTMDYATVKRSVLCSFVYSELRNKTVPSSLTTDLLPIYLFYIKTAGDTKVHYTRTFDLTKVF